MGAKKEEWLKLAGEDERLKTGLERLYDLFKDAPTLGSLINPKIAIGKDSLFGMKWEEIGLLLTKALSGEQDDAQVEMGVVAQGMIKAAELLISNYNLVMTNVPYLGRGKQFDTLRNYCDYVHPKAKSDLLLRAFN